MEIVSCSILPGVNLLRSFTDHQPRWRGISMFGYKGCDQAFEITYRSTFGYDVENALLLPRINLGRRPDDLNRYRCERALCGSQNIEAFPKGGLYLPPILQHVPSCMAQGPRDTVSRRRQRTLAARLSTTGVRCTRTARFKTTLGRWVQTVGTATSTGRRTRTSYSTLSFCRAVHQQSLAASQKVVRAENPPAHIRRSCSTR
jgi:hypothetical protein